MDDDYDRQQLAAYIALTCGEQAVRDGEVEVEGKTDDEIRESLAEWMQAFARSDQPFVVQRDHGTTLVAEAMKYQESGRSDLAILLAATQVEHWLNYMLLWASTRRREMAWNEAKQVVRANLQAKTGWVWRLLYDEPMPPDLTTRINALGAQRNVFVHYKWESFDPDADDDSAEQLSAIADDGLRLIEDLHELEDRLVFYGKRAVIARVLSRQAEDPLT